jgi:hypothetical protein
MFLDREILGDVWVQGWSGAFVVVHPSLGMVSLSRRNTAKVEKKEKSPYMVEDLHKHVFFVGQQLISTSRPG